MVVVVGGAVVWGGCVDGTGPDVVEPGVLPEILKQISFMNFWQKQNKVEEYRIKIRNEIWLTIVLYVTSIIVCFTACWGIQRTIWPRDGIPIMRALRNGCCKSTKHSSVGVANGISLAMGIIVTSCSANVLRNSGKTRVDHASFVLLIGWNATGSLVRCFSVFTISWKYTKTIFPSMHSSWCLSLTNEFGFCLNLLSTSAAICSSHPVTSCWRKVSVTVIRSTD